MRLTQNLTLALTLTVTFIAGVFAIPNDFPTTFYIQEVSSDNDKATVKINADDIKLGNGEAPKLMKCLTDRTSGDFTIQTQHYTTGTSGNITLDNGAKLTITAENETTGTKQKLKLVFDKTGSKPDFSSTITFADIPNPGTNALKIDKPAVGLFATIPGSGAFAMEIRTAIDSKIFRYWSFSPAKLEVVKTLDNGKPAATGGLEDATDAKSYCYAISDKGMLLCVKYTASGTKSDVFVRPGTAGWGLDLSKAVAPALTFLVGAGCAIISSHVHKNLDPDGYAAGYEASSLPGPFKAVLATPEGFEGVDYYDDQPGAPGEEGMIKIDSQGRRVRVKRDSTVAGGEGADSEQTEKKEGGNAYGVSAIAALLLLPFLL